LSSLYGVDVPSRASGDFVTGQFVPEDMGVQFALSGIHNFMTANP
jgi:hypothetical protein